MVAVKEAKTQYSHVPSILAAVVALAGIISFFSAITPGLRDRVRALHDAIPLVATQGATVLTIALSVALILLALELRHRKHRAWVLTLVVLGVITALHIVKGLDIEEALITLGLLVAVALCGKYFFAEGDPATPRRVALSLLWYIVIGALLGLLAVEGQSLINGHAIRPLDALRDSVYSYVGLGRDRLEGRGSELVPFALLTYAIVGGAYILFLWFKPRAQYVKQLTEDRAQIWALFNRYGTGSLDYFALRHDKSYFFSPTRNSFIAYKVMAGVAVVSGDPIGDPAEFDKLAADFSDFCARHGWRMTVFGVGKPYLKHWEQVGLKTYYIGDEAVVNSEEFSLEGRSIRKVRQSCNRLKKAGYSSKVVRRSEVDHALRQKLDAVSNNWLGGKSDRGFSMEMDSLWPQEYGDCVFAIAFDGEGVPEGFVHLVPFNHGKGLSLSSQRRMKHSPNGLIEFICCELFEWTKENGVNQVTLNFSALGELIRDDKSELTGAQRALRWTVLKLDRFFQINRILIFNKKFLPEWMPRYVAFDRYSDLPLALVVLLSLESLIEMPEPLVSWRHTARPQEVMD